VVESNVERADRFARRRAGGAIGVAAVLMATQASRMSDAGGSLLGWLVWAALVLAFLVWASGLLGGRKLRVLANDESSEQHRRAALLAGFWAMLASCAFLLLLTRVKDYPVQDGLGIVLTVGIAASLLGYGAAELRALSA